MSQRSVALVHDYLTQRGGAERVVLLLARAFPGAPLYTSLYEPAKTFPEFAAAEVRTLPLNRLRLLRNNHRSALPFLAPAFSRLRVHADVVICSSSGWAHGARVSGRKIVYCYTPARWLYQPERYLRGSGLGARAAAAALRPWLIRWDRAAAASADVYIADSTVVAERINQLYGIEAEVLHPPPAITPAGVASPMGIEPGFIFLVSRLLPYKNVDAVVDSFASLPEEHLVIAGTGPEEAVLRSVAPPNVTLLGRVSDEQLRWLYGNCSALVAASHEDYGLTPLEAATFGKPSAVLRWGGFLDTVAEGTTGVFFDEPSPERIRIALAELRAASWDGEAVQAHAGGFSEERFIARIRAIVHDVAA